VQLNIIALNLWQRPAYEVEEMAKQSNEGNKTKKMEEREWDNPILEDYKEELLRRPSVGPRLITTSDAQRLARLEGLMVDLHQRVTALERKIDTFEGKR
jgi:hypothetical protein